MAGKFRTRGKTSAEAFSRPHRGDLDIRHRLPDRCGAWRRRYCGNASRLPRASNDPARISPDAMSQRLYRRPSKTENDHRPAMADEHPSLSNPGGPVQQGFQTIFSRLPRSPILFDQSRSARPFLRFASSLSQGLDLLRRHWKGFDQLHWRVGLSGGSSVVDSGKSTDADLHSSVKRKGFSSSCCHKSNSLPETSEQASGESK